MKSLDTVFDNMDRWRNLPDYQLERRADIFFSIYMVEALSARFCVAVDRVIPEFPIRKRTIHPEGHPAWSAKDGNSSCKVDYLAVAGRDRTAFLVELKTDDASWRGSQDKYLVEAQAVGLLVLLDSLKEIYRTTKAKRKYRRLLAELQELGLIALGTGAAFSVTDAAFDLRVVYIQPRQRDDGRDAISFDEFASIVDRHDDPLSTRFARSLRTWASVKAGQA